MEEYITHEVKKLEGVGYVEASYEDGNAVVRFDNTKTSMDKVKKQLTELDMRQNQ